MAREVPKLQCLLPFSLFPLFFFYYFLLSNDHFHTTKVRKAAFRVFFRRCSIFIKWALSYCEINILGLFSLRRMQRITFQMINFASVKYENRPFHRFRLHAQFASFWHFHTVNLTFWDFSMLWSSSDKHSESSLSYQESNKSCSLALSRWSPVFHENLTFMLWIEQFSVEPRCANSGANFPFSYFCLMKLLETGAREVPLRPPKMALGSFRFTLGGPGGPGAPQGGLWGASGLSWSV